VKKKECPFCFINTERNTVLEEGSSARVIFSDPRLMFGHLLVTPKRHILTLSELNTTERDELWEMVVRYQGMILKKVAKGCDIRQHYRPFLEDSDLKQSHLHIHLQPRDFNDDLYQQSQIFETDMFERLPQEEVILLKGLFKFC
jgi:diadenosine tetraphosphate (Ap4A) HIT family hydrolase